MKLRALLPRLSPPRWWSVAIALGWALQAPSALALCPNCLGQQQHLSATLKLVGLFLLVPFAVAAVIVRLIRRAARG